MDGTLIKIENLSISFKNGKNINTAIFDSSFEISKNKIVGIVGESGSGKSVTSMALMGLLPKKKVQLAGSIVFDGVELTNLSLKEFQKIRGKQISMIFQEPMSALNPSLSCGFQVAEILKQHKIVKNSEVKKETLHLFEQVKLPNPNQIYNSYPHQISGGQMQRVMIAMAIACKPQLLIADEPTTALDVTVQKEILELLKELQVAYGMSLLFISHDLSLVSEIVDSVLVMKDGYIVEQGLAKNVFNNPQHPYTKALLASRPSLNERLKQLPTIASIQDETFKKEIVGVNQRAIAHKKLYTKNPILEINNVSKTYITKGGLFNKDRNVKAVAGVSFNVYEGETLGLVGESGCGKSTLGKVILKLEDITNGIIKYRGKIINSLTKNELKSFRKDIQLIFQDPFSSLNPRIIIGKALTEPMEVHNIGINQKERKEKALALLERVGLSSEYYYRYPHELSGGQRQRVGIARTIAMEPKVVICDESVSALDISVQAQVLNLLNELKEDFGFTYIFISHDLAVVKYMSDQLVVMNAGKIEEMGDADEVYANPIKPYTQRLINAIPGKAKTTS
ncbi:ABC transporter ATP-binding protein [Patiriisocius marinus]|uniref:ABC transporter ATP-binding protein n=1 Tax=Patiriisocius marinus TaxID=1397112 RepID=UPI00232F1978|nr:ABC transporter ATP-binding protein [Patiriisocius marinus]